MSLTTEPEADFKRKSRTFSLAAMLFAAEDRQAIARLYAFCRALDDYADTTQTGDRKQLQRVLDNLSCELRDNTHPVARDFLLLARERELPLSAALALARALCEDCGPRRIESESELIRFAFGVAGTVGLLICPVLRINKLGALPFAVDLGIAFQLTNIARDVAEDASRGRFYLPSRWVSPMEIEKASKGENEAIVKVDRAVKKILDLAEKFYASALRGMFFIPARNRRAIFIATILYREIGHKSSRQGAGAWRKRMIVSPAEKGFALLQSIPLYRRLNRDVWMCAEPPTHDPRLKGQYKEAGIELSSYRQP